LVVITVQPDDLSQNVRIPAIGFSPRCAMTLSISSDLHRVDRIHLIPGGSQSRHPRSPIGFDTDHHIGGLGILIKMISDHRMQFRDTRDTLRKPPANQATARLVHHLHIVVILSPIIPHK
jgi:hypothetical protein